MAPPVPSQDVSRYQATDPVPFVARPSRLARLSAWLDHELEMASRGLIRWLFDRSPWWLALLAVLAIVSGFAGVVAWWILSPDLPVQW
jgi:hypothetical protein